MTVIARPQDHRSYIDLNQNEVRNLRLQNLGADPGSPVDGLILYRTDTDKVRVRINGAWQDLATMADVTAGGISSGIVDVKGDLIVADAADSVVRLPAGTNGHFLTANSATATGLEYRAIVDADIPAGIARDSEVVLATEKGAANGVATLGADSKVPSAQLPALALTDVSVVADITARDALTVQEGDVAIVTDAGGGQPATFIYDGAAWQEIETPTDGVSAVTGGTGINSSGGTTPAISIDTAVVVRKFAVAIGDGAATSFTVTHNLNTSDVTVSVYLASGTYEEVEVDVQHTTVNTVTVVFTGVVPTADQYRVVVHG